MSAPKAHREYIVLESQIINAGSGEVAWRDVGAYLAHDDDAAVRYHIDKSGADSGNYRAVARSAWEPLIRIKVIKTTKLTLEHGEKRQRATKKAAKRETELEGQFDGDGMEREATPEDLDVDPLRPIDQIAEAYKSRMDYPRSPRLGH